MHDRPIRARDSTSPSAVVAPYCIYNIISLLSSLCEKLSFEEDTNGSTIREPFTIVPWSVRAILDDRVVREVE